MEELNFVPVPRPSAENDPLMLRPSEAEMNGHERDHFQDILLSHVSSHQGIPCKGLTRAGYCQECGYLLGDAYMGKKLRLREELYLAIDRAQTANEEDDGFDPEAY